MTEERFRTVQGVLTATQVLKLRCGVETLAEAAVRLGGEYGITLAEAEEVAEGMEKRKAA